MVRKEALVELRGRHGLYTSLLFAIMTTTAMGVASARSSLSPSMAAGMFWVALLFAGITGLARTFVLEEEQGTGDLLRLWSAPEPVFLGKLIYNFLLLLAVSAVVAPLFVLFTGIEIEKLGLMAIALLAGCAALASGVSLCGALVARSKSRGALAGVISIPVLLPVVLIGVGATRIAFGDPGTSGLISVFGLAGLAISFAASGPLLYAAVWKQ